MDYRELRKGIRVIYGVIGMDRWITEIGGEPALPPSRDTSNDFALVAWYYRLAETLEKQGRLGEALEAKRYAGSMLVFLMDAT